jgi:hypothetical protein
MRGHHGRNALSANRKLIRKIVYSVIIRFSVYSIAKARLETAPQLKNKFVKVGGPAWISTSIATPDVRVADVPPKGFDNQDIF